MPNGKPGDHPITDILIHKMKIYSNKADNLIKDIVALGGRKEIEEILITKYNQYNKLNIEELETELESIKVKLTG